MTSFRIGIAAGLLAVSAASHGAPSQPLPNVMPTDPAVQIDAALAVDDLNAASDLIERNAAILPPGRLALARADYALATGEVDAALAAYAAIPPAADLAARVKLGIGIAELRLGHGPQAIAALDAAVAVDPTLVKAWIARGVAADRDRAWVAADAAYMHALAIDPRSSAALANRGYSKLLRGRFAEAASDSTAALAIDPKMVVAANNLRLARAMQGDYKTAFAGSTKATLAHDLNTVGFAAMTRGDYATAETFFTRAMHLSPQFDHTAWNNLLYLKQLAHASNEPGAAAR